jgi:hypothetical protein
MAFLPALVQTPGIPHPGFKAAFDLARDGSLLSAKFIENILVSDHFSKWCSPKRGKDRYHLPQ